MSAPETASLNTNLVNLVIALLTPMFLWATAGDIRLAQIAAAQTLNEHRIANRLSLFRVAKIIAFDIATLSSLSLSMYEDVAMLLALRLRSNAVSLDRAAERNRHMLEQESRTSEAGESEGSIAATIAEAQRMVQEAKARVQAAAPAPPGRPDPDPAPLTEKPAAAPAAPAARMSGEATDFARGRAMTQVAEEVTAGLTDLPSDERRKEMARIEALSIAASDLVSGTATPTFAGMTAK